MVRGEAAPVIDDVAEDLAGPRPGMGEGPPGFDEGPPDFGEGRPPFPPARPIVSNARLGMLVFLGAEAMFFAGLISAFLVFRLGSADWPPPGQPRLPIGVTWANTAILLCSAYAMRRALVAIRGGDQRGLARGLLATVLLGATFLCVQGSEWLRLVRFGLTLSSGTYGATFYTLIGCHGLHVFGAVVWLLTVLAMARRQRFSARDHVGLEVCGMYWTFVVALWPILFALVYLA